MKNADRMFSRVPEHCDRDVGEREYDGFGPVQAAAVADLWEGVHRRKRVLDALGSTNPSKRHPFRVPDPETYYADGGGRTAERDPDYIEVGVVRDTEAHVDYNPGPLPCPDEVDWCIRWIVSQILYGTWVDPGEDVSMDSGLPGTVTLRWEEHDGSGGGGAWDGGEEYSEKTSSERADVDAEMSEDSSWLAGGLVSGDDGDVKWSCTPATPPKTKTVPSLADSLHPVSGGPGQTGSPTAEWPVVSAGGLKCEVPPWASVADPGDEQEVRGSYRPGRDASIGQVMGNWPPYLAYVPATPDAMPGPFDVLGPLAGFVVSGGFVLPPPRHAVPAALESVFSSAALPSGLAGALRSLHVPPWPVGTCPAGRPGPDGVVRWTGDAADPTRGSLYGRVVKCALDMLGKMTRTVHVVSGDVFMEIVGTVTYTSRTPQSPGTTSVVTKRYSGQGVPQWDFSRKAPMTSTRTEFESVSEKRPGVEDKSYSGTTVHGPDFSSETLSDSVSSVGLMGVVWDAGSPAAREPDAVRVQVGEVSDIDGVPGGGSFADAVALPFIPAALESAVVSATLYMAYTVETHRSRSVSDDTRSGSSSATRKEGGGDGEEHERSCSDDTPWYACEGDAVISDTSSRSYRSVEESTDTGGFGLTRVAGYSGGAWTAAVRSLSDLIPSPPGDSVSDVKSFSSSDIQEGERTYSSKYSGYTSRSARTASSSMSVGTFFVVVDWDFSKIGREEPEGPTP